MAPDPLPLVLKRVISRLNLNKLISACDLCTTVINNYYVIGHVPILLYNVDINLVEGCVPSYREQTICRVNFLAMLTVTQIV